jgi:hypothetical protein
MVSYVFEQHWRCKEVVHWNVEKTLNLIGVQVQTNQSVATGNRNQVSDQFGANGHPGQHFGILAGVAIVG